MQCPSHPQTRTVSSLPCQPGYAKSSVRLGKYKDCSMIVLQLPNSENEPQMDKFVSENQLFANVES